MEGMENKLDNGMDRYCRIQKTVRDFTHFILIVLRKLYMKTFDVSFSGKMFSSNKPAVHDVTLAKVNCLTFNCLV